MTNELSELKFLNMRLWEHNRQRYVYDVFTESATLFQYDEETTWEEVFYQLKIGDNSRFVGELFTGVLDKKAKPVYVGDIIEGKFYEWASSETWVVKFGQYKQDGSGGEYDPSTCLGFYVESLNESLMEIKEIKVIGNVHEHSHLLETEEK